MSNGSLRPGGLTALAICNFVFAGLGGLNVLGLLMLMSFAPKEVRNAPGLPSEVLLIALMILGSIAAVLLIVSGIGYLLLKKILGRVVGSIYGVFALSNAVFAIYAFTNAGGDVGLQHLVGFIYPVLTIVLLNTTFRNDFVY